MQSVEAQRALNRSKEVRAQFWHVTIAACFFVVIIGTSLFLGTVMIIGTFGASDPSNDLTTSGRAGRFARTLRDGTLCHYMVFDNTTAQTVEDRIGRCDENKPKPKQERPATFIWGK
jgi:hypothetical protein